MRILIIANPLVGIRKEKKKVLDDIVTRITDRGGSVDVAYSMKPGVGNKYASRSPLEGYDAVMAAGGDGTINDVASGLINRNIPLGIIPLGTGNGLARSLEIPCDPEVIVSSLFSHKTTTIDTGRIGPHTFLATAGIGFDAYIARDFNNNRGEGDSIAKYFMFAVKNYFMKSPERITLTIDGQKIERKIFALTFCNMSQYGGGAVIAPHADPRDGRLLAVLVPKFNPLKASIMAKKLFDGSVLDVKGIEYISFTSLKLHRENNGIVQYDGETFTGDPNLTVSVAPSSLIVVT